MTDTEDVEMMRADGMFPLRRVVDRNVDRYKGWVVTLDCGHRQAVGKKELLLARHRCVECPPGENTAIEQAPLRNVVSRGQDKDGVYEVLSCRHTLYGPPKPKAAQRRCRKCLEDARTRTLPQRCYAQMNSGSPMAVTSCRYKDLRPSVA